MSEEGKKDALPPCLPDPSVHQRCWKTSIHQHPAVPPSHHDCPVGELPQVSIRSSLKEPGRCFWQLWETTSEQLEVSGGCLGIAQSSGFLNFPYPKEVHSRPHPNYWGAISGSHQLPVPRCLPRGPAGCLQGCLCSGHEQTEGRGSGHGTKVHGLYPSRSRALPMGGWTSGPQATASPGFFPS